MMEYLEHCSAVHLTHHGNVQRHYSAVICGCISDQKHT